MHPVRRRDLLPSRQSIRRSFGFFSFVRTFDCDVWKREREKENVSERWRNTLKREWVFESFVLKLLLDVLLHRRVSTKKVFGGD